MKCPDCNGGLERIRISCPHCGRDGGGAAFSPSLSAMSPMDERHAGPDPKHGRDGTGINAGIGTAAGASTGIAARPMERLPERKPFPLEWFFPAMLVGTLGAIIGMTLPGQPWQPDALIGFFLVILPMKK